MYQLSKHVREMVELITRERLKVLGKALKMIIISIIYQESMLFIGYDISKVVDDITELITDERFKH